jgi:hypothetical protein
MRGAIAGLRRYLTRISIPGANRPEYVGIVEAPDQQSAEAAAVKKFKLSDDDRKRLVVRTRD